MAESEFKIGELEDSYDNELLVTLSKINQPLKRAVDLMIEKTPELAGDVSYNFKKISDFYDKIALALTNYDDKILDLDKEKDLDIIEERRSVVEEALEQVDFEVEKLVDFLKKEI